MPFDPVGPAHEPLVAPSARQSIVEAADGLPGGALHVVARGTAYLIVVTGGLFIGAFTGLVASFVLGLISIDC